METTSSGPPILHDSGLTVSSDVVRAEWGLPPSLLADLRAESEEVKIVEVSGDSGYDPSNPGAPGSIYPGDRVICIVTDRRPSPPGPFLVWDGIGLVVKLVEIVPRSDPPRIRLSSRNPNYSPYEATDGEAYILGRVKGRVEIY